MKKPRFLIDVDDVICDFKTPALHLMQELFGHRVILADMMTWDLFEELPIKHRELLDQELSKPGYCTNLQPHPEALEAVQQLRALTQVVVVTSPYFSPTWVHERILWLEANFGFSRKEIVVTEAKYLISGDFFLDDRPTNVVDWQTEHPHGVGMLWATPNTNKLSQYDSYRVFSWAEVLDKVNSFISTR